MKFTRWILFLPAGLIFGTVASIAFRLGAEWFPKVIQDLLCGSAGAMGTIYGGLKVAPVRNSLVKWILIVVSVLIGIASCIGSFIKEGGSPLVGIATVFVALCYCSIKPGELLVEANQLDRTSIDQKRISDRKCANTLRQGLSARFEQAKLFDVSPSDGRK